MLVVCFPLLLYSCSTVIFTHAFRLIILIMMMDHVLHLIRHSYKIWIFHCSEPDPLFSCPVSWICFSLPDFCFAMKFSIIVQLSSCLCFGSVSSPQNMGNIELSWTIVWTPMLLYCCSFSLFFHIWFSVELCRTYLTLKGENRFEQISLNSIHFL